jgi:rhombotail lipoprotein
MSLSRFIRARPWGASLALVGWALLLGGCVGLFGGNRRADQSSSVVAFLYPNETNPLPPTTLPVLRLPLRVGIAFVPPAAENRGQSIEGAITEAQKTTLLARVAREFQGLEYISAIEVIPASYLRPAGGFENLAQLRNLFSIDVVALVAYDQVQFTNENRLSVSYWTIVGAYFLPGNKNDTHTLMESAVYDIESRHLLFRAPGVSHVDGTSTLVNVPERLRTDSSRSFEAATDDLVKNLRAQLESFRERVKQAPDQVARIEHRPGYQGAGSTGPWFSVALGLLTLLGWRAHRRSGVGS